MLSIHGTKVSHSNRKKSGRGRFLYKKERIAIGHNSFEPQQLNGSHDDFNNEDQKKTSAKGVPGLLMELA